MIEPQTPWIGKAGDPNPVTGSVTALRQEPNSRAKVEYVLYLATTEGPRRLSLWGENLARACAKWGNDETKWPGKNCQVLTEEKLGEKKKRVLLPL